MIPIQGLWIGERLSRMEQLCILSFMGNGHPFHLYVYDEVEGIPPETTVLDARDILPPTQIRAPLEGDMRALFADWFRWELLYQRGGVWSDMDCVCLKPLDDLDEAFVPLELNRGVRIPWHGRIKHSPRHQQGVYLAWNGLMRLPAGHAVAAAMRQRAAHPFSFYRYDYLIWQLRRIKIIAYSLASKHRLPTATDPELRKLGWGVIAGPQGLARYLRHRRLFDSLVRSNIVHLDQGECERFFTSPAYAEDILNGDYYVVHLHNTSFARSQIDKDDAGAAGSFYARMLQRYGLD